MPKRINQAMGDINSLAEPKVSHVAAEHVRGKTSLLKTTLCESHTGVIQINGRDIQATIGKFNHLPTAAAADLKDRRVIGPQIPLGGLLNEIRFRKCFVAKREIPVSRGVVTIGRLRLADGTDERS
jgi:hypothetical protein